MGGTVLQPAVDYVEENLNSYSTLILTDGYCDSLDLSRLKKHVLIVSAAVEVPIRATNGKMKQINVSGSAE
jgi:predicted metal-dependent peptidase